MSAAGSPLRASAYRGAFATVSQQAFRVIVQMASLVTLARILAPEDFGVYAMVIPIAAIVNILQDMGLQDAIIQRPHVTRAQVNKLYWINLSITALIAVALIALSPLVAHLYNEPRVGPLMAAWSVPVVIGGLAYQQYAMLTRDMRFLTLALIDVACVATGFVIAVAFALRWDSYWALWASGVASALVWAGAATAVSGWRPSLPSFKADTDGMLKFGAHLTGVSGVNFLVENLDNMLIGRAWGAATLGFYDRAYKLLLFPVQNVTRPIARIAIPVLSRLQDEPERFRRAYLRIVGQATFITVPSIAAALAVHEELILVLLGERWMPAAPLFAWLGVAALHQPTVSSIDWLMRVQARTGLLLRCTMFTGLVTVSAFVIGLPDGALGVARAFTIADLCIRLPLMIYVAGRSGAVRSVDLAMSLLPVYLAAGATYALVRLIAGAGVEDVPLLAAAGVVSYSLSILVMAAFKTGRETLAETYHMAERGLRLAAEFASRRRVA